MEFRHFFITFAICPSLAIASTITCHFNQNCLIPPGDTAIFDSRKTIDENLMFGQGTCRVSRKQILITWNYETFKGLKSGDRLKRNKNYSWCGSMYYSPANNGIYDHFSLKFINRSTKYTKIRCDGRFKEYFYFVPSCT